MKILTVLGTRPEIIRLSRIVPLLDQHLSHTLIHTGQNSADNLSGLFFRELGLREPDLYLGVDTSSVAKQVGSLLVQFEQLLDKENFDRLLILGDTNSALVAFIAKRRGLPVYHMEAGNRCFDTRVPEEVNRKVIDHCSSILLPYTERSAFNLVQEGIPREKIFVTGNPIFEVLEHYKAQIQNSSALKTLSLKEKSFLLATLHRAENVDTAENFDRLCTALIKVSTDAQMPLILSVHPRIKNKIGNRFDGTLVQPKDAFSFFDFVRLEQEAALVLTDSGTVQEECAIFGTPVVTVRDTTERPETIESGSNLVSSTKADKIIDAAASLLRRGRWENSRAPNEYLAADVSDRVLNILLGTY